MVNTQKGRFFILGFDGLTVPASLKKLSSQHGLGGVILFDRNIESPQQLKELTAELKSLVPDQPLIISIDQEGGQFQRLKPPLFTAFPSASKVGEQEALSIGQQMGQELAEMGINLDFAPVLDVNTNPDNPIIGIRSFGSDPKQVAKIGKLFIQGLQESGVRACGKHFPGHGDTAEDSHLTLPVVKHSADRLHSIELLPFRETIAAGLTCLMPAHIIYPALDPENPATFSQKILNDLLRKELRFEGIVVTDDLGMAGSLSQGDLSEVCIQAFAAGCDRLLVCDLHERHGEIIEKLEEAINTSEALQDRARASLKRI